MINQRFSFIKGSLVILGLSIFSIITLQSQGTGFEWPDDKRAAISLSFDDARESHPLVAKELFRKLNCKVTFYVVPSGMKDFVEDWKEILADGHEIGNHTIYHPCTGNFQWSRDKALENYTLASMKQELLSANQQINEMLDVVPVSFAYTCGNTFVGRGLDTKSYVPLVAELFENGRGWLNEASNDPEFADLALLQGIEMDGKDFTNDIKPMVDAAIENGTWLLLAGHEIGQDGRQTTRVKMLEELVAYVKSREDEIWLAPVGPVAAHLSNQRRKIAKKLKSSLTLGATFDNGFEADFAIGNKHLFSAPAYDQLDHSIKGIIVPEVGLAMGQGKVGSALEFKRKGKSVVFYKSKDNIKYNSNNWSGTISFWLSLDPEEDLAPGFTDPIQITDQGYDDGAIWVDFSDKNPRDFRMGVFGDAEIWNPEKRKPDANPDFINRLVVANERPFRRGRWTHIGITYFQLNSPNGHATFYIDGKQQGSSNIPESISWQIEKSKIFLGLNFVGLIDELALFDRALDESEINSLYNLPGGLHKIMENN